jgi:hypothetical protein
MKGTTTMIKNLFAAVVVFVFSASAMALPLNNGKIVRYKTKALLDAASGVDDGVIGVALDTDTAYLRDGTVWVPLDPNSPEVDISFTEGASKGYLGMQSDGTAYDSTAATLNYNYYPSTSGSIAVLGTMNIVDAGNTVPAADAEGLDVTAGNVTDNDHIEIFSGTLGTTPSVLTVGTSPAVKFCTTWKVHDVTGSDFFYCGFRTAAAATVSMASYTDYCALGSVSGNYGTNDKTTGATDSGSDAIADDESDEWCIYMSSAGVCSYQIDSAAVASADGHTIGDGLLVEPFCQLRHDADGADDTWLQRWKVSYTGN